MEHHFNIEIAKKYDIVTAVLLNNFEYWTAKNEANEKNYFDGRYWTYNSKSAFCELFPYLTARQIDYALNKMIKDGLIISGNYNENKYDRTLWYAITDFGKCILQNCQMEETKLQNDIYNSNIINENDTDKKPNNKNNKENIKENIEVLDYLNEKAGTHYKPVESNLKFINARLKDYTIEDLKSVVDKKVAEWKGTTMQKYLRVETLFNATKFESYLNGLENIKENSSNFQQHNYTKEQLNDLYDNLDDIKLF